MKIIYKVEYLSNDRSLSKTEFYEDRNDAYQEADLDNYGQKVPGSRNTNIIHEINVWEKDESNETNRKKMAALSKLTSEEQELLGVKYDPTYYTKIDVKGD